MRTTTPTLRRLATCIAALACLLPSACDKQSLGANPESEGSAGEESDGTTTPGAPDCGELFCADNPDGLDCIDRCEDDPDADGCWFECDEPGQVDCWGGCDLEDGAPVNPLGDVGDGTFSGNHFLIAQTDSGPFYILLQAERLGDTFQGTAQSVLRAEGGGWIFSLATPFTSTAVQDNEVTFLLEGHTFPAGRHPFGPTDVVLDIEFQAHFSSDTMLCGVMKIEGDASTMASFGVIPLQFVGESDAPTVSCE